MPEQVPQEVRRRLAVVLDVDDLVAAARLARSLRPYFGVAKVGLELYSAAGPEAITMMQNLGYEVFADLKLHDIPNTVAGAARVMGSFGVKYLTIHTAGGLEMLRAGVEAFEQGAESAELERPVALGVTILTSDETAPTGELERRASTAVEAGCGGLVCAAPDLEVVNTAAPQLMKVTPGIRPLGTSADDQQRVATPGSAIRSGADLLVIGRAVLNADDPVAAAAAIATEVEAAIS